MINHSTFGGRLRDSMTVLAERSVDVANRAGMDRMHYSHILSGRRDPSFPILQRILKALPQVDARWLITGEKL